MHHCTDVFPTFPSHIWKAATRIPSAAFPAFGTVMVLKMLRSVFVGYDSPLGRVVAHWLSQHTILGGCLWIPPSERWFKSWRGRLEFARRRIRRRGLLKACDEAAFRLHYSIAARLSKNDRVSKELIAAYWRENKRGIHQYFGAELRSVSTRGTYLWHTGIMPQYRGLYSPFWAIHNLDFSNIGYSLFRVNDVIDGGEVFVQGRICDVDVLRDNHTYIAHKLMFASFQNVARFICDLERGTPQPLEKAGAASRYYSYPGISDYFRQRRRIRRFLRQHNGTIPSMQT